jgi:hypothetical protein
MKRFQLFILIVTVGFFLMPVLSMACEMKSGKSCCNKEMSSKDSTKDCCKKNKESKHNNHDHSCNGKCGNSNCVTYTVQFNLAFFEIKFKNNNFVFLEKEQNYIHSQDNLSSGYSSLWLIPKIS